MEITDTEKPTDAQIEQQEKNLDNADGRIIDTFSPELERRVRRKLDLNILTMVLVLYTLSVLDRSNIGNAKTAGMQHDLKLSDYQYNWLLNIFYISYILFEFSVIGWKLFKPHIWISFIVFAWGLDAALQGAAFNWQGMMTARFFLGMIETGFGPGLPLYLTFFYPRREVGLRIGIFLSGSAAANAYGKYANKLCSRFDYSGGTLAYGLSHITGGLAPWRWLFIVEGVPTMLVAIIIFFTLPDDPSKCYFLNDEEKKCAVARAARQPRDIKHGTGMNWSALGASLLDYKNYFTAFIYFGCNVSFASLPVFLPTILNEMGFSALRAQGLTAPPYLLCFFLIIATAFVSDRMHNRGLFLAFWAVMSAVGWVILATASSVAARYVGVFFAVTIFVSVSQALAWVSNNSASDSARAGGLALLNTVGQCGPLLGVNSFPASEGPFYRRGMWTCFAFALFVAVLATTLSFLLRRENRRRDEKYGKGLSAFDEVDVSDQGSDSPMFRFVC